MILPITTYGTAVLRKEAKPVTKDYEGLSTLIENMFDTLKAADGIGLAAPQVNHSIRLFVVDASALADEVPEAADFRKVFINPVITKEEGEEVYYSEGCLSIPGIYEDVKRSPIIHIEYYDENFEFHQDKFEGLRSRIVQHEYDHLEGILFTDKLNPLKKRFLKGKLGAIGKGKAQARYKTLTTIGIK